ncbi:carbohydrate kinase family protein [Arthrobacter sp. B2a2-09]|uniref:carbohydrate kinase family protein n=1 Tax=Arthrobacter sp. B2a2-09 TaxID=2952822 RepID=UPI0022CD6DB8|nr:carbohydrate kinase family protein [Arthrobacter sp. B2a2-09]MCZ9880709.1 carbohydrate kinase family protein [Arthrobacter sp. B2a2-09]
MDSAARRPTAFFIGDVALDVYFTAERWPGLADKASFRETGSYVGGSIANAAAVHAGLGGSTEFISLLNHGALTERLLEDLGNHGLKTTHMLYHPEVPDSRNMIFLVGGEHVVLYAEVGNLPMAVPAAAMVALRSPGHLYMTLSRARRLRAAGNDGGELAGDEVLADLRSHGRRLVFDLDVDGFTAEEAAYLRGADVIILNEIGFGLSFGGQDLAAVNDWMRSNEVRTIIRTLAAAGAEIYDGAGVQTVPGYTIPVVDVTGAGDTFGGALVFALAESTDLRSAVESAVAAASRAVTIEGPRGGVASSRQVEEFRRSQAVPLATS